MQLTINGKQLNVADVLRGDIEKHLPTVGVKYFENPTDRHANMSKQGNDIRADVSVVISAVSIRVDRAVTFPRETES